MTATSLCSARVVDPSEEALAEIEDREAALEERKSKLGEREESLDARAAKLDEREEGLDAAELEIEEGIVPGTGLFLVGEDIQPRTYRGHGSGGSCYWARLTGTSGEFETSSPTASRKGRPSSPSPSPTSRSRPRAAPTG